jgi:hypothetical protein
MNQLSAEHKTQHERLAWEVKKLNPWLSLHGWAYLIFGALYSLTIIGAVIGIPLIIAGVGLINSTSELYRFAQTGDSRNLEQALAGQKQFYLTTGILFIVTVILPIVLTLSLVLTLTLNPDVTKEFNSLRENIPKTIPKINIGDGQGREV